MKADASPEGCWIYWFTGQPGAGKTTLARALKGFLETELKQRVLHIDGDDLRLSSGNRRYCEQGRRDNIGLAGRVAREQSASFDAVIVTLVSPYREMREELKATMQVREIFVHTSERRGKEQFFAEDYEAPLENFLGIDTTNASIESSLALIRAHCDLDCRAGG